MIFAVVIILFLYLSALLILGMGYRRESLKKAEKSEPKNRFSIIIPFRNEAENLPDLLKSLSFLKYPLQYFEIIFINDESDDNSEDIILNSQLNLEFKILQNERMSLSPKKDAILKGIDQSQFDWIVTTDADCVLPQKWLKKINDFINHFEPEMILGPVIYKKDHKPSTFFQLLDNISLQFVTRGAVGLKIPVMANGANLIYKKSVFKELEGFSGNKNIASGDDVFLLEKFRKRNPKKVIFLNSDKAIVETKPVNSWTEIINQRVRWASKTKHQKNWFVLLLGIIVTITNFLIPICFIFLIFPYPDKLFFILFIALKISADFFVLFTTKRFYKFSFNPFRFFFHNLLYSVLFPVIFFRSIKGNYNWKSRNY